MSRNLVKTLLVLGVVAWSLVVLYPTWQARQYTEQAEVHYQSIEQHTTLARNEINAALSSSSLELDVRDRLIDTTGGTLDGLLAAVTALVELDEKRAGVEDNALVLGLDLQGGTYLVYEIDMPQLLRTIARESDEYLEQAITRTEALSRTEDADFFELLQDVFAEDSIRRVAAGAPIGTVVRSPQGGDDDDR